MENDRAKHRPPEGALAAKKRHRHHEYSKGRDRVGNFLVDKARHIAGHRTDAPHEECRNGPSDSLVGKRRNTHCLCLVLVIADGVDGQSELRRIQPPKKKMRGNRQHETEDIEEGRTKLDITREQRHRNAGRRTDIFDGDGDLGDGDGKTKRANRKIRPAQSEHEGAEKQR